MNQDDKMTVFQSAINNYLRPILPLLQDKNITEVLINKYDEIFVEKEGKLFRTEAKFQDEDSLIAAINSIAQSVGRRVDTEKPILDARLPDGSRIAVVLPPCARKGATISIRKFTKNNITFKDYIKSNTISALGAQFLDICMYLGKNVLVSGGTGSGKTTLLSLLCSRIPKGQRIIVIEDSSELNINYEHLVMFETRMADQLGNGEINIRDLLKSSLRLRPDRIIVGEVRGAEALELINAMNTGHKGCMGTIHANSPSDAIVRLEALAQGGEQSISERALRYQVSSAVDIIVQISRYNDGSRRINNISEVLGLNEQKEYIINPIFHIKSLTRTSSGHLEGEIETSGNIPSFIKEIEENRLPLSVNIFKNKKTG